MIKSLRKRHRQIWALWAVLLPAGILLAWLAIPNQPAIKLLQSSTAEPLPVIIKTYEAKDYSVKIRSNTSNDTLQVEWCNKTVLIVPSAVIYKNVAGEAKNFNPEQAEMIGRIEATGNYLFPLTKDSTGTANIQLVLYDFIHERVIDTINFSNSSPKGGGQEGAL